MLFQSVVVEGTRGNYRGKLGEKNKTTTLSSFIEAGFFFYFCSYDETLGGKKTTAVACLKTLHCLKDITSLKPAVENVHSGF